MLLKKTTTFIYIFVLFFFTTTNGQKFDDNDIIKLIEKYKTDARGPYRDIRWFCKDSTTVSPDQRCSEPGGVQRARYKDEVILLGKKKNIFLGQILSTTGNEDFWDNKNQNSRLKQYQLEKYLRSADNGWILRRAQFYRGAFQAEDEDAWGLQFYIWLLSTDSFLNSKYFEIRQSLKDIPHSAENNRVQNIRALSKTIAEILPTFMNLRVKIHGQPEFSDLQSVINFRSKNINKLTPQLDSLFNKLTADMEYVYQPVLLTDLNALLKKIPTDNTLRSAITDYIKTYSGKKTDKTILQETGKYIWLIRQELAELKSAKARLAFLDLSIKLEEIYFREISSWQTFTMGEILEKNYSISMVLAGCGFIENWEWDKIRNYLLPPSASELGLDELNVYLENTRRIIEWGTSMVLAKYENVVDLYKGFEPLASGFCDDQIRSSLLLQLGSSLDLLSNLFAREAGFSNTVFNESEKGQIRGLNPGYAFGELVVISESTENIDFFPDKIYFISRPPADLKPVAGIATVSEGNLVSHVQLLARNLGIPNAVVSKQLLETLKKYSGQKVFFAVSQKGTIILKEAGRMNEKEKQLFEKKVRSEELVSVPVDKINFKSKNILNLKNLRSTDSGKLCGPKAANLGELKYLFPENVVEGLVIPFSIFKQHLDQVMPNGTITYWQFIQETFKTSEEKRKNAFNKSEIDDYVLNRLTELREAIKKITLLPELVNELRSNFITVLGSKMGTIPVFIRSDTNMEDLKDFTGAGLNLTIFNVLEEEKIFQGIKDVWASPYSERSYRWRQKYLLNPENVFPSILIIPSVNVEKSGVMITKGVTSGNVNDVTVAFSRGAGGAVEGQIAESYLLAASGNNILLSPSRELIYNQLPSAGGTDKGITTLENPLLSDQNLSALRAFAGLIKQKLSGKPGFENGGPFDIELGFLKEKIWLFQVRPFVENKKALSSSYLEEITPKYSENKKVNITVKI